MTLNSLQSVAAILFLHVDIIDNVNHARHVHSAHHIPLPSRIPYQSSSLFPPAQTIKHSKQQEPDSSIQVVTHVSDSFILKISPITLSLLP